MLVLGNGESRSDLRKIPKNSIGCNALHRQAEVDHLVCVDQGCVKEALTSDNTKDTVIYTRKDWINSFSDPRVKLVPDLPYQGNQRQDDPWHWGSGPYAVLIAAGLADHIDLVGFDLYSKDGRVNNVYKGTANYREPSARAVDPRYWVYQIGKIFQCCPDKYFTVYNEPDWQMPDDWRLANVSFKSLDNLQLG